MGSRGPGHSQRSEPGWGGQQGASRCETTAQMLSPPSRCTEKWVQSPESCPSRDPQAALSSGEAMRRRCPRSPPSRGPSDSPPRDSSTLTQQRGTEQLQEHLGCEPPEARTQPQTA